ncbi:hypothetical protein ISCGN_028855 [Ixodes scapularis]
METPELFLTKSSDSHPDTVSGWQQQTHNRKKIKDPEKGAVDVPGTNAPASRRAHRERRVESSESPAAAERNPSDALAPTNGGTSAQSARATILAVLAIGVLFVVVVGLALFLDTDPAPKAPHALNKTSNGSLPLSSGNGSLGIPDVISFGNRR